MNWYYVALAVLMVVWIVGSPEVLLGLLAFVVLGGLALYLLERLIGAKPPH